MNSSTPSASKKVYCLMGPTGTGKSGVAIELARSRPFEIINCDSMQVYRGLDVGTAKVSQALQNEIPHHLLDIRNPEDPYSAADFALDAKQCINEIYARGHLPLLVGGTGLYFRFLENGYTNLPKVNKSLRVHYESIREQHGNLAIWEHLNTLDSAAAKSIDPNDFIRIVRSIEIYESNQKSKLDTYGSQVKQSDFVMVKSLLTVPDREALKLSNRERTRDMLSNGWIDEVVACLAIQNDRSLPASKAVGYRQILKYLDNQISLDELEQLISHATNQYMKRQITWFSNEQNAITYSYMSSSIVRDILKQWFV